MRRRVGMATIFYPRGGSAQVIRYLGAALDRVSWSTELVAGSLGPPGERTNAQTFYRDMDLTAVDYSAAAEAHARGEDALVQPVPMHPSYEPRAGAADRLLAGVSPQLGDRLESFWKGVLERAYATDPEVLHLHHLTPIHGAAARALPDVPLVTHLHGTELKMIERALVEPPGTRGWEHAAHWVERMRGWAQRSRRLIVISPHDSEEAGRLLGVDPDLVTWVPNGVQLDRFDRSEPSFDQRMSRWREWLVEQPLGWSEGGEPGSVSYTEADLSAFADPRTGGPAPVLLFVGRFTEVKRIPLLIRAYARARESFSVRAPLVIWGGFPGEWEGEHPHTVALEEGAEDVFFIGWRGHDDLNEGLACADVMVMPSISESFGQVFVEAMACGVPVIAANAGGPPSFVNVEDGRPNGWLVEPDDLDDLAAAMVSAVNDPAERTRRADNGYVSSRRDFSWATLAERVAEVYEEATAAPAAR